MNEVKGDASSSRLETTSAGGALRLARSTFPRLGASVAANSNPSGVWEVFEPMRAESSGTVLGHTPANGSPSPSAPADVVQLIDQARIFFETNREFARRCLRDACDLLGAESQDSTAVAAPIQCAVRPGGLAGWQAIRALNYIEENLGSTLRVGEVARSVGLSSSRFFRAFKVSLGVSPGRYVARVRVERAKLMLISTGKSLCDISADCGFADQSHLNRHFRRVVSMSPGMWRCVHASAPTRGAEACARSAVIGEGRSRSPERWARHLAKISSSIVYHQLDPTHTVE
jgi:AraC-like DNA-binding protein